MKIAGVIGTIAPSLGPAIVSLFGVEVPILALSLSIAALMLARAIAPPPLRTLEGKQQIFLTLLLLIFLFLAVTGQLPVVGDGHPLGVGMAVVWGTGLGFSGLLVVELMGERVISMVRVMIGRPVEVDRTDPLAHELNPQDKE